MKHDTMDFDGSVQSTNGKVEGTAVGYNKKKKGARSYWPLFCTVAQTGQIYDMHHRPGNVHDSNGAPGFMEDCINDVQTIVKPDLLEARVDSAFYNKKVLPLLNMKNVEFTCSVPFERFTELKGIIEARSQWNRIDEKISYFECDWKPKSWRAGDRILFIRTRRPVRIKGPLQLDLFEPKDFEFEYKVIATNKSDSAENVLLFHNGRGEQEGIFAEAKQHAALDLIPTKKLLINQLYTLSCMLAHNLTRELQMRTRPVDREMLPKRPSRWIFQELGTIRQRILHLAGRLTRPQGELTLSVNDNPTVKKELEQYLESLKRAA